MATEKKMKTDLVKFLKKKKIYDKEVDDKLIESLILNYELIDEAKKDIKSRGVMVDISSSDRPFYQINFSISVFHNSVKSINTILKQLGIEKAKIEVDAKDDAFENLKVLLR